MRDVIVLIFFVVLAPLELAAWMLGIAAYLLWHCLDDGWHFPK